MAVTINNFVGFETGGLEEASAINGAPSIQSFPVRSGAFALKMDLSLDQFQISPFESVADQGDHQIFGFAFRKSLTPFNATTFFLALEGGTNSVLSFEIQTGDGDLRILDANDALIGSAISAPFQNGEWHFIECRWEHSASGRIRVLIDGVEKLLATGQDLTDGGTFDTYGLQLIGAPLTDLFYDDFYCMSGSTADSDVLGDTEIFKYQSVKASVTPDDGGKALDSGAWDDAGETPLVDNTPNNAEYTSTGAGAVDTDATNGFPEGPANDVRIDGDSNIKAAKAISGMKRSGGGQTDHFILFGNDVDGTTRSVDLDPNTQFDEFFFVSELATIVPLSTEHFRIGFEMTNAQDYECREQWAMILHVPTPPPVGARRMLVIGG